MTAEGVDIAHRVQAAGAHAMAAITGLTDALAGKAASANGVTNGDSHDHAGGDGGTIDYDSLASRPFFSAEHMWAVGSDFLGLSSGTLAPYGAGALASGTLAQATTPIVTKDHPGCLTITSSSSANSGQCLSAGVCMLLGGGESIEAVFLTPASLANVVAFFGYHSSTIAASPSRGAWFDIAGTTLTGKTKSGAPSSTTGTSYTLDVGTWYRARMVMNADATRVDFYLYSEVGALVWSDFLTTNIPTTTTVSPTLVAYESAGASVAVLTLDYMAHGCSRTLVR